MPTSEVLNYCINVLLSKNVGYNVQIYKYIFPLSFISLNDSFPN